jgi:hypothetical protein
MISDEKDQLDLYLTNIYFCWRALPTPPVVIIIVLIHIVIDV